MKEGDKITARDLNKTEIRCLREFKVIFIKILTGLEKKVEDMSETLNKEIENIKNQSEINNIINKIKKCK